MPAVLYSWSLLISLRSSNSTVYPPKKDREKLEKQNQHQWALLLLNIFSNPAFCKRLGNSIWGILIVANISLEILLKSWQKWTPVVFWLLSPVAESSWNCFLENFIETWLNSFSCSSNEYNFSNHQISLLYLFLVRSSRTPQSQISVWNLSLVLHDTGLFVREGQNSVLKLLMVSLQLFFYRDKRAVCFP